MSKSLLILTPNPDHPSHHGRWPYVLEAFREALYDLDLDVFDQPWSEPVGKAYDLICPLVAWGYHNAPDDFRRALAQIKAKGHRLLNPAEIVSWNVDKRYLRDLAQAGVRTIPTAFVDQLTPENMATARADFGQDALVLKPVVSAGAKNTLIWEGADVPAEAPQSEAMIQPLMRAIQTEGEWSLLFFGGAFSHAVLKTPKAGDFRSQPDYDAHLRMETPPYEALQLAYDALDFVGRDQVLYARVDMVRDDMGRFCLMELELIEPDLYLKYDDDAPERLAKAFAAALHIGCGCH
ncbi:hypothetical protein Q1W73_02180 [Asticcacaulis sp. ZE23SCel15]|uniref:ATP-grasp domain-containing protein n=1 Tax=Asticcacaulis sp. ZE23SCel15 TaxID=3059027 RepID=UPI00265EAD90|nr:hypothetical protein [Asticcacaulis sp. ZE23SCel15]WKL57812.1 hypothetical protein Q1W73_02180 [Asticcacaulis sp. ZE23SCel15]